MIAHQWRQPLNALGMLIQDYKDAHQYDELDEVYLEHQQKEGKKLINYMSDTIDNFRNFTKPKEKTDVLMSEVIENTIYIVNHRIEKDNIIIIKNFKDDKKILLSEGDFSQAVINIINNAIDAIIDNKIESPEIQIEIINLIKKDGIEIKILDNAGGILEKNLKKIFEPYFSTKSKNSSGLGLYMSKMIIFDSLKGIIFANNNQYGASFIIQIPFNIEKSIIERRKRVNDRRDRRKK